MGMKRTKIIIVDDEFDAIDALTSIIEMEPDLYEIMATETNPVKAVELINELKPDVIFLDIEMPELTGFDMLRQFKEITFEVIFATAFEHYALQAIKNNAIDYIVKPFSISEVLDALLKVRKKHHHDENKTDKYKAFLAEHDNLNSQIMKIPTVNGIEFANVNEIIYLEADGNYTKLIMNGTKNYIVTKSIKIIVNELPIEKFLRTHRSYVVNTEFIRIYDSNNNVLIMANTDKIPLARRRYRDFKHIIDQFLG
jgi:two-component system LytT family response regulator